MFGWKPGIGDPTIYGWVTVAAYALGAILCWHASRRGPRRERRFWLIMSAVMAFLCINKQLDLQTLMTDIGRAQAKLHGWYADRRTYQAGFVAGLAVASVAIVAFLLVRSSRASNAVRGAIVGLALLLLFVFVRASSMDQVDTFLSRHLGGVKVNHALELGSIAIVAAFAWLGGRPAGQRR